MTQAQVTETPPEHGHPAEGHHTNYVMIWAILVGLLVVSVCGPLLGIKIITMITAFGIALVKAYLVAKNFMHLNIQPRYVVYLLLTMICLLGLFFTGVGADVMQHEGTHWVNVAANAEVARGLKANAEELEKEKGPLVAEAPKAPPTAAESFKTICAACHGEAGNGQGPGAAALNPKPANFTDPDFLKTRDKKHIEKVIREGGASVGKSAMMVSFRSSFTDEQISALADYVISLNPNPPAAK